MSDLLSKRLRRVIISPNTLGSFLTFDGMFKAVEGIPKGSSFRGFSFDALSNSFFVFIEHPSFDEIPEGDVIPMLDIRVQTYPTQEEDEYDPHDLYGYNKAYPKITLY